MRLLILTLFLTSMLAIYTTVSIQIVNIAKENLAQDNLHSKQIHDLQIEINKLKTCTKVD